MTDEREGERPGFDVTRRGYRTSQVDAWVDRTAERLGALMRDLDDARQLARSLQASLDEARARSNTETFGARAEKVLRLAEHDARLRREAAEREAEEIRDLVHFEAERTVTEARSEAGRMRETAERDADRIRTAAAQEVGHIRAEAEQQAERLHAAAAQDAAHVRATAEHAARTARAELTAARRDADLCADTAASMHEHVRGVRSAVRDEVARLHAALAAELRTLDAPDPRPQVSTASVPAARTPAAPTQAGPAQAGPAQAGPAQAGPGSAASAQTASEQVTPAGVVHGPADPIPTSDGSPGGDEDTGAVARVVALPEQRDRPPREQLTQASDTPAVASGE